MWGNSILTCAWVTRVQSVHGPSEKQHLVQRSVSLLSVAVINMVTESNLGKKGFICLTHPEHSSSLREWRARPQELKQQTLLPGCSQRFTPQPVFSHNSGSPAQERRHPQLAGPSHINHLSRRCPKDLPTGNLMATFSQLSSLFREDSNLCPVDAKRTGTSASQLWVRLWGGKLDLL